MLTGAGSSPSNANPAYESGWQATLNRWLPSILMVVFLLGVAKALIEPLFSSTPWMTYFEDDFFYYLKIAQNLAHGSGSTFNGIVPTNGYHPLWLLLLAGFSFFASSPVAIMKFIAVVVFVSTATTFFLARRLLRVSGVGEVISTALAVYIGLYSMHLYVGGMEVVLTIPLLLGVIVLLLQTDFWTRGFPQAALLGLLVSAMVLSRLDSILLAGLLFLAIAAHPGTRRLLTPGVLLGFAVGALPLALYFVSNQIFFHTWMPVSGMAKQMKFNHHFAGATYATLLKRTKIQLLTFLIAPLTILLLPALWKRLSAMQQVVYPVVLAFPFIYLSILSFLSDWKIWDWYFYSFRAALCIAFSLFCLWRPTGSVLRKPLVGIFATLAMLVLIVKTHRPTGDQIQLLQVAEGVSSFAVTHPGTYSMGDRSGMVGYLLSEPLVQTEGLVMGRDFLDSIRRQLPLRDALEKYHVRYYIATTYPPYESGCVHVAEPYQAGPESPHMPADFCEPPVVVFQQRNVRTSIYDLHPTDTTAH
ncbi:MAG TPA: hypothetical protein VIM60_00885 [Edaphobacter sp.]